MSDVLVWMRGEPTANVRGEYDCNATSIQCIDSST